MLQAIGHAVDDLLADSRESEHKKQDARKENDAQGCAPRYVHAQTNVISEVSIERHSRSERDRVVGENPHDQGRNCSREASRKDHAVDRHACLCQDLRVHNHDVGHREESREATQQLLPYVCLVLCQPEISTDQMRFLD